MQPEKLIAIILEPYSCEKMLFLKYINDQQATTFSINQVASALAINYKKACQLAEAINQDFSEIGWSALSPQKGLIIWISDEEKRSYYVRYLVRQSVSWQLLSWMVNRPNSNLAEFCEQKFVSRSTLKRRLKPLVAFLKDYQVELDLGQMNLYGEDEGVVQLLLFAFCWFGSFGEDLLENHAIPLAEQRLLKKLYEPQTLTMSRKVALSYLLITKKRLLAGYPLPINHDIAVLFPDKLDHLRKYFAEMVPDQPQWSEGCAHSLYFTLFAVPYLTEKDWRLPGAISRYQHNRRRRETGAILAHQLMEAIQAEFVPSSARKTEILMTECNLSFLLQSLGNQHLFESIRMQTLVPPDFHQESGNQKITQFCLNFLKESPLLVGYQPELLPPMAEALTETLIPFIKKARSSQVIRVALQPLPNYQMGAKVSHFLEQLNFVQYELWVPAKEYDFYIGLTPAFFHTDKPIYLITFQNQDDFGGLFQQLLNVHRQKIAIR